MAENRQRDRRRGKRVAAPFSFLVFWTGASGRHHADLFDLSADGCFLNTAGIANAGETVTVEIPTRIALGGLVRIRGEVIAQQRKLAGFGVRFAPLAADQQLVITGLLAKSEEKVDRRKRKNSRQ